MRIFQIVLFMTSLLNSPLMAAQVEFPAEIKRNYFGKGWFHRYLVQEPEKISEAGHILIYMHGNGGMEEQGMDPLDDKKNFYRLRRLMNEWGWIYVCPRDPEFDGLVKELKKRYGDKKIYIAGASAGAIYVLFETTENSKKYAGTILLCPALWNLQLRFEGDRVMQMPAWIVAGESDQGNVDGTRKLVAELTRLNRQFHYIEIPQGDHDSPLREVNWEKALNFVQGD